MTMQPEAKHLRDIALWDPVVAYAILLGIPQIPFYMSARGSFNSFVVDGTIVPTVLDTTIDSAVWVQDIRYSVKQPNVFAGNIGKATYDADLRQSPGVDAKLEVYAGPKYIPALNFTPLENLYDTFIAIFPTGWKLYKQQSIKIDLVLTSPPPSISPNAPPYNVCITLRGWQFLDPRLECISCKEAVDALRQAGIFSPQVDCR